MRISIVQELANTGDPYFQFLMGILYEYGLGVPKSKERAKECYVRAAEQDFVAAQYAVAILIDEQGSETTDQELAFYWCREAAESGYAPAQSLLSSFYEFGGKTNVDPKLAHHWTKQAAEQGFVPAIVDLARMYEEGVTVELDSKLAMKYFQAAAEKGDEYSAFILGLKWIGKDTEESVAEGLKWMRKAAVNESRDAYEFFGRAYKFGLYGMAKDQELAEIFLSLGRMTPPEE